MNLGFNGNKVIRINEFVEENTTICTYKQHLHFLVLLESKVYQFKKINYFISSANWGKKNWPEFSIILCTGTIFIYVVFN